MAFARGAWRTVDAIRQFRVPHSLRFLVSSPWRYPLIMVQIPPKSLRHPLSDTSVVALVYTIGIY